MAHDLDTALFAHPASDAHPARAYSIGARRRSSRAAPEAEREVRKKEPA